ncbi:lysophospholipase [Enterobacter sp. Cy-643]|uniref:alpha/beta hydrolase n=1 Tax=Enterobacter sp. Cy-643 TaxID=2608346 RepID=UPI00142176DE|nr:alpha/beta fold hydrolase [Enterobacter sp. Cy-643]NIF31296.1 lysophospholipase [Enterobacter sp. Cy-643]
MLNLSLAFHLATMNMFSRHAFDVSFQGHTLKADSIFASKGHVLMIHGGSKDREASLRYRYLMAGLGFGSTAFDCIGHGETGGELSHSSLINRTDQALAIAEHLGSQLTGCMGVSMGAYNALKLSQSRPLRSLILMVPGVYHPSAYRVNFGPEFSAIIRQPRSWAESDAWQAVAEFSGNILVIAAAEDRVIPAEIPPRLYDSASGQGKQALLTVPGADHNSVWQALQDDPSLYDKTRQLLVECLTKAE